MTDNTNEAAAVDQTAAPAAAGTPEAAAPAPAAVKVATLADNMPSRENFADLETALNRWNVIVAYPDATGVQTFFTGLDTSGNEPKLDFDLYPDTHEIMIGKLTEKAVTQKKADGTEVTIPAKTLALYVHPVPTLEHALGLPMTIAAVDAEGNAIEVPTLAATKEIEEMREIIRKEWQLRLTRPIRNLKGNFKDESANTEAQEKMPRTLAEYLNGTRTGSGLLEAFNKLAIPTLTRFKELDKTNAKAKPIADAVKEASPNKAKLRNLLSNAAYARFEHGRMEAAGIWKQILITMIGLAKAEGLNTSVMDGWLATRDAQTYDPTVIDLSTLDMSDLFGSPDAETGDTTEGDTNADDTDNDDADADADLNTDPA